MAPGRFFTILEYSICLPSDIPTDGLFRTIPPSPLSRDPETLPPLVAAAAVEIADEALPGE